jgi:putative endonuclease
LLRRVYEHKNELIPGFTKTYHLHILVYFEQTGDVDSALYREKQLKWWRRQWKLNLITNTNPEWKDLWDGIGGHDILPEVNNLSLPHLDSSIKLE